MHWREVNELHTMAALGQGLVLSQLLKATCRETVCEEQSV